MRIVVLALALSCTALSCLDPSIALADEVVLPTTVIHGRPQAPQATYFLPRARSRRDAEELRRDLVREVAPTVRREPF
jgi:hypothetical protein